MGLPKFAHIILNNASTQSPTDAEAHFAPDFTRKTSGTPGRRIQLSLIPRKHASGTPMMSVLRPESPPRQTRIVGSEQQKITPLGSLATRGAVKNPTSSTTDEGA